MSLTLIKILKLTSDNKFNNNYYVIEIIVTNSLNDHYRFLKSPSK